MDVACAVVAAELERLRVKKRRRMTLAGVRLVRVTV